MKNLIYLLTVFCSACSTGSEQIKIAIKDTPVYLEVNDDLKKPAFLVKKGEQCKVGKNIIGKVDRYYKVTCNESITGWIVDIENFTSNQQ